MRTATLIAYVGRHQRRAADHEYLLLVVLDGRDVWLR